MLKEYLNFIQEIKNYEVKTSRIHGKGIFAKTDLPSGINLGVAFTKIRNTGTPDKDYKRSVLGIYVNHSTSPNIKLSKMGNNFFYITIKNIRKGQELLINYYNFPWEGERSF
jgi:hypothetical protein